MTEEQIASYQMAMWTGIFMSVAVLTAVLLLACMDPGRDSLLYANFQADVSSKHD